MKFNILFLALVSLVLVTGLVSADSNVYPDQVTGNATSVVAGSQVQISFVLKNTFTRDLENIKILLPTDLQNAGSWNPSVKIGTSTVQVNNGQIIYPSKVDTGTSSSIITLTFTLKNPLSPEVYKSLVTFQGTYESSGSSATITPLSISITVPPAPTLSVVQLTPALSNGVSSTKIALNNTGNVVLSNILFNLTGDLNFTLVSNAIPTLAVGAMSNPISIDADLTRLHFGDNVATITARASDGTSASTGYTIRKSFCSNGQRSTNLTLRNADITEYNEKVDSWKPTDSIAFEVEVKSNVPDSDNVVIEMGLFDEQGINVVDDLIFTSKEKEQVDVGNIGDDSETAIFEFRVPADMPKGNYKLTAKAFSDDEGEDKVCVDTAGDFGSTSFYKSIKVENEKEEGRYIVFDNIRSTPTQATCGDSVALTTDVFNIGTKKQDQVRVNLFNRELGLDQNFEIKKDLNIGDKQKGVSFVFSVPKNVPDKTYNLELTADYNYDKSQDEYDLSTDTSTDVPLKVFGCVPVVPASDKKAEIVASLDSEVVAGKNVVVKATIRNIGNTTTTYALGVKGIDSWATLGEVSPGRVLQQLAPGQSKEVTFTLATKADAKGEQSLIIEAVSDRTDSKTFTVTFPEVKSGIGGINLGGNTLLWIVGAVNVVLLILIILVAIRLSRR